MNKTFGLTMPLTRITTNFSLEGEQAALCNEIQMVLHEVLGTPQKERLIIFDQNLDSFFPPPDCPGNYAVVEISLFPGRGLAAKRELYEKLAELFSRYGVEPFNTRMVLREVPTQDWGIRGGKAACDVLPGFDPKP